MVSLVSTNLLEGSIMTDQSINTHDMNTELVVDSFAGPGGWDHGLQMLGYTGRVVGIEWDTDACKTGCAAGHERVQLDVREARDLFAGETITGTIASPPCQGFSLAGKGKGRADAVAVIEALKHVTDLPSLDHAIAELAHDMTDERTTLVLEPLRWALAHRPRWLAWEQVPAVQPLWDACAIILRACGYSVDTGVLNSEQYGVPQTRRRAVLVAHKDRTVTLPTPTHSRYYSRSPAKLDQGVLPWVSMSDALGWGLPDRAVVEFVGSKRPNATVRPGDHPAPTIVGGHDNANRHWRFADEPKWLVTNNGHRSRPRGADGRQIVRDGEIDYYLRRPVTDPAPTLTSGANYARWDNAERNADGISYRTGTEQRKVTVAEAAVLQTFPADYPWQGSQTSQYQQVGNAIPPVLAAAVLRQVIN